MLGQIKIIVAATEKDMGIGYEGKLPWKLKGDMENFTYLTIGNKDFKKNIVIFGRKTYFSIPKKRRPLVGRCNVVISSKKELFKNERGVEVFSTLQDAIEFSRSQKNLESIWICGGSGIYQESLDLELVDEIYLTRILKEYKCDTFFPEIPDIFRKVEAYSYNYTTIEDGIPYKLEKYVRKHEEEQYLNLIKHILQNGILKDDRTGVGTLSIFGSQMKFSLRKSFPLLTTKRTYWKGIVEELLWFIKGSTDSKVLSEKGVKIWDANGSRKFLDSRGLKDREEGDLGPVYGFQWRHWGAEYKSKDTDYTGKGIDQLKECIKLIKKDPNSRRIILSAWNPSSLHDMALPPCHMMCQFYVAKGELSCQMYQRSCDMGLGVPFNIASYALLTLIIAKECDLKPGDFIHTLGDAHIYKNHIKPLKEQLKREPYPFPIVSFEKKDIESYTFKDFKLKNYKAHKTIKMDMAV